MSEVVSGRSPSSVSADAKLELLFLRLASTDSDEKLANFIGKHLVECISLAAECHNPQKVTELLSHLNRRIKHIPTIAMPFKSLLVLLRSTSNAIVSNFTLVYLKMAFEREISNNRISHLPELISLLSNSNSSRHNDDLLIMCAMAFYDLADVSDRSKWPQKLFPTGEVRALVFDLFYDILLMPLYARSPVFDLPEEMHMGGLVPAGMSPDGFSRCKNIKLGWEQLKTRLVKVAFETFDETETLFLLVIALANESDLVTSAAEATWKRLDINACLKQKTLLERLFNLYLGNAHLKVKDSQKRTAANLPLKLRIFSALLRSEQAPVQFPLNIKVAFDGLFTQNSPLKLQIPASDFLIRIVDRAPADFHKNFSPIVFASLKKLIQNSEHGRIVAMAYQNLGLIGKNCPGLITSDMALLQDTFDALSTAPEEVSPSIADCLSQWLPIFTANANSSSWTIIQAIITSYVNNDSSRCRLMALKYFEVLLKSPDPEYRWTLCRAYEATREEIKREAERLLQLSLADAVHLPDFGAIVRYFATKLKKEDVKIATAYLFAAATASSGLAPVIKLETDSSYLQWFPAVSKFFKQIYGRDPECLGIFVEILLSSISVQTKVENLHMIACAVGAMDNWGDNETAYATFRDVVLASVDRSICSIGSQLAARMVSVDRKTAIMQEFYKQFEEQKTNVVPGLLWLLSAFSHSDDIRIVQNWLIQLIADTKNSPNTLTESAVGALSESLRINGLHSTPSENAIDQLGQLAQSRREAVKSRLREMAVLALGFAAGGRAEAMWRKIVDSLLVVGEGPPQPELQFTLAEALFTAVMGDVAPSRRNQLVQSEADFLAENGGDLSANKTVNDHMTVVLDEVIGRTGQSNRHLRQASLIWLSVLVKHGSVLNLTAISSQIDDIQAALLDGLTEDNELAQDVSSMALGVLYSIGTESQRNNMVTELVGTLSGSRKPVKKRVITADTTLFRGEELGKTPSGETLGTYKELCSLATDLNQPDLIYKFLHLANHNAMWNSKMGAMFGFSVLLEQAKLELEQFIPQLIPKLFRYRFDPDQKVQQSMRHLWQTLLAGKKNVVFEYAELILNDIIPNLVHGQWRVRESSCVAIGDLIGSYFKPGMLARFGELFENLFRVQDDVKESVRLAATRAVNVLSRVSIRESAGNSELVAVLLPILIEKGLHSMLKANRAISLSIILSLSKDCGPSLKPHLPLYVGSLLDAIGEGEHQLVNYIAVRASADELEVIDDARAAVAGGSQMMRALQDILVLIDVAELVGLTPVLGDRLHATWNLPTRIASSQFIVKLCLHRALVMTGSKSQSDRLLQVLGGCLNDRNVTIRKQFSATISYLIKFCSNTAVDKLIGRVRTDLLHENEENNVCALFLMQSIASHNVEVLQRYTGELVPMVFLAKCKPYDNKNESEKLRHEQWEELWSDLVPGTDTALRLYGKEMLQMAIDWLKSHPVYTTRSTAAIMIVEMVKKWGTDLPPDTAGPLFTVLCGLLSGRLWDGKWRIFEAISALLTTGEKQLRKEIQSPDQFFAILLKESAKKKNPQYQGEAIYAVCLCCEVFHLEAGANEIAPRIGGILMGKFEQNSDDDEDAMETDAKMERNEKRLKLQKRVADSYGHWLLTFEYTDGSFTEGLNLLCSLLENSSCFWQIKMALVDALKYALERWKVVETIDGTRLFRVLSFVVRESSQRSLAEHGVVDIICLVNLMAAGRIRLTVEEAEFSALQRNEVCMASTTLMDLLKNQWNNGDVREMRK